MVFMEKINVDKIYVLTIERHESRRFLIDNYLQGLEYEYYYGFDAPQYFSGLKYVSQIPQSFFLENAIDREYVIRWNIGQLGAYLSIREMIKKAFSNGYQRVLFFEDDIVPLEITFTKTINLALKEIDSSWHILQLGFEYNGRLYKLCYNRFGRIFFNLVNFVKRMIHLKYIQKVPRRKSGRIDFAGNALGGHAFILSREGMELLINKMTPLSMGGDVLINDLISKSEINAFSIYPILFKQRDKNISSTR